MANTSTYTAQRKTSTTNDADRSTSYAAQGSTSGQSRFYGYLYFPNLDELYGKDITKITMITSCTSKTGWGNGFDKSLGIYSVPEGNQKPVASTGNVKSISRTALGSLLGMNFYDASNVRRNITGTLFEKMKNYLQGGHNSFVIYKGDSVPSSGYSDNYLWLNACKLEIEWEDVIPVPTAKPIMYGTSGQWRNCDAYYGVNGQWKQVISYYGLNGQWVQTSRI
ncbi:hypothetical protein LJC33_00470 [Eubacteriales bacterium OttesenSCG-928-N13]|nr:hypothetical protein [Eubacteriales bacterium OttesenSCG-928-N13]